MFNRFSELKQKPYGGKRFWSRDYGVDTIGLDAEMIDLNLFSIKSNLVVVNQAQAGLIKLLEKQGLDVITLKLRYTKMLGGTFRCVISDIRRTGTLQRYFD